MKKTWVLLAIGAVVLFVISGINKIPTIEEKVNASWAQVQNQYQRRADLIPNLVETVKGYAKHENQTLEGVIQARAEATKVTLSVDQLNDPEMVKKFVPELSRQAVNYLVRCSIVLTFRSPLLIFSG